MSLARLQRRAVPHHVPAIAAGGGATWGWKRTGSRISWCEAKQSRWQVLPLNPTSLGMGNSPYGSDSAFAGDVLVISPERLIEEEILTEQTWPRAPRFPEDGIDYPAVGEPIGGILLDLAWSAAGESGVQRRLRVVLPGQPLLAGRLLPVPGDQDQPGRQGLERVAQGARDRKPAVLKQAAKELSDRVLRVKVFQYIFDGQWQSLRAVLQ